MSRKQFHQNAAQIMRDIQLNKMVNAEVDRRLALKHGAFDNVNRTITQTHRADAMMYGVILHDKYEIPPEVVKTIIMDDVYEFLSQYQTDEIQLRQLERHFKASIGVSLEEVEERFRQIVVSEQEQAIKAAQDAEKGAKNVSC